jgi:hypothetical protein
MENLEKHKKKHNIICVRHHHTQDEDTQNKITTQYVLDTTIRKQHK